ncbi:hypothetical protein [Pseudomonas aeruginosa]|uniref:hypothetical protein n=1 Tax=Pseudomonas aeruginosa TaxID=287 RepID=UPI00073C0A1D|nr:hypothetical protein [Pseudomonas aeruginosa]QBI79982.1 hypothetical protein [Pseudomonas phage vB_Pae_CF23a]QBI80070.1 hypothetical protein [Pseudomonas phage vB_Pae_CF57a]QBI80159.1 hypothetical protein [Pseudomonas phage vB_Pae_CF65a]QBI80296.1 hypothetical protein [Pseudomonas phage vB_Pae_CF81a]QBI80383.1 hypothetical protein [Pseudomonas phage vB_Pae_CF118a]QBI80451.1 hypothetical protein [Pseudomonas phage vB_Pae_CF121b]QBI80633.1 hypothetical protein [Pseudomonas phage vB_Pae_CF17
MSIQTKAATIYFAPTARKSFITKRAAINAEARAIINKHFPIERGCSCGCGDPGWRLEEANPERFARYYRLLTVALKRTMP